MEAQELRIKNLVVYNGSVFTVTGISKHRVTADRGKGEVEFDIKDLTPLRITDYWLKRFDYDYSHWGTKWILEEMPIPTGINFVHQLQNIYFALVGKELNQRPEKFIREI